MKTETPHTIAELWHEADGLIRLLIPHLEKLVSPDYQVNDHLRQIYAEQLARCNERLQELRQQLLDKCESEYGLKVVKVVGAMVWHDSKKVGWNNPKNYGSAWLFMDWELEQRENEAQNGN